MHRRNSSHFASPATYFVGGTIRRFDDTIDGRHTTLIYQVKDNGDGKFTDVLAIANRAINLDEGRLIIIRTLDDDGRLDRFSQTPCSDDLKFIMRLKRSFREDLAAFNADIDGWEPAIPGEPGIPAISVVMIC